MTYKTKIRKITAINSTKNIKDYEMLVFLCDSIKTVHNNLKDIFNSPEVLNLVKNSLKKVVILRCCTKNCYHKIFGELFCEEAA
jgi:type III secretory pathway component EscU